MPAIESGLILVSGASAFIGAHCCRELLERGFSVRGTVRSTAKGDYLSKLFKTDKFSYVIVEDVQTEGAFDSAVEGVDGVLHVASPFHFKFDDPVQDLINPAVKGTTGILFSSLKSPSVKRIVITSSNASIITPKDPPYTFTEKDWNTHSPGEVERLGKKVAPPDAYRASKVLAERAAWDFLDKQKPKFDIVTMCPPLVLGPIIHEVPASASLNTSVSQFRAYLMGEKKPEEAQAFAGNEVDVRDLAFAHVQGLTVEEASNQRYAISNGPYTWQDVLDVCSTLESGEAKTAAAKYYANVPKGTPGSSKDVAMLPLDGSKAATQLGVKYISLRKTVEDMLVSVAAREDGWRK